MRERKNLFLTFGARLFSFPLDMNRNQRVEVNTDNGAERGKVHQRREKERRSKEGREGGEGKRKRRWEWQRLFNWRTCLKSSLSQWRVQQLSHWMVLPLTQVYLPIPRNHSSFNFYSFHTIHWIHQHIDSVLPSSVYQINPLLSISSATTLVKLLDSWKFLLVPLLPLSPFQYNLNVAFRVIFWNHKSDVTFLLKSLQWLTTALDLTMVYRAP